MAVLWNVSFVYTLVFYLGSRYAHTGIIKLIYLHQGGDEISFQTYSGDLKKVHISKIRPIKSNDFSKNKFAQRFRLFTLDGRVYTIFLPMNYENEHASELLDPIVSGKSIDLSHDEEDEKDENLNTN